MAQTGAGGTEAIDRQSGGTAVQQTERAASAEVGTGRTLIQASTVEHVGRTIDRHKTTALACGGATRFFRRAVRVCRTVALGLLQSDMIGSPVRGDRS